MTLNYNLVYIKRYIKCNKKYFKLKELIYLKMTHRYKYDNNTTIKDLFIEITNKLISFMRNVKKKQKLFLQIDV